ncbi:MAG TPA: cation:dicarboxylase symporter family transporter [Porticoccus sp.]|nr:cation:dicarboxylase symporter family transporter [Porticoccus sp.]
MTLNPLKLSPFMQVMASLILGVAVGLFFGEVMGKINFIGQVYIQLLQMTVIPYILVSLISSLGSLDMSVAKKIGIKGGGLVLFLWVLSMLTLLFMPLAYPSWTSASFFSSDLISSQQAPDLLSLYIPSNPFYSMANTMVPAIVVFSIFLGVAMIGVENKKQFLLSLQNVSSALMNIASAVAKIAPIGIFALSAAAAGTLDIVELNRLQIFLWGYFALWLIFVIFTLPMLVAWATPFTYAEVIRESKLAVVTAFATGTVLVVLPIIAERTKYLLSQRKMTNEESLAAIDVLVPTTYSFPSVGTLMGISFILFSAWFTGSELSPSQYPAFTILGILTSFGSLTVALPFMLDYFKLPSDMFQLYLLGSIFTMRMATALAAMHGIIICLLGATAIAGKLSWRKLYQTAALSLLISAALMFLLGKLLTYSIPYEYTGYKQLIEQELVSETVAVQMQESIEPLSSIDSQRDRRDVILERGTLRVAYLKNRLPYAFRNKHGNVVGYDMAMIHSLAKDLGVTLEIIRLDWPQLNEALDSGKIDIVVGGISLSVQRALEYTFSNSYMNESLGLIVADHDRNKFSDYAEILKLPSLKLAAMPYRIKEGSGHEAFPDADIIEISNLRDFFKGKYPEIKAMLYTAEAASAWTLIYPNWVVVVPKGLNIKNPVAYILPQSTMRWQKFVDTWLEYQANSSLSDNAYQFWILGKSKHNKVPRWSFAHDVLGWDFNNIK